tara:strand:- start:1903 stop:2892 length:990 start_codon:yes stop_codon:yes gene_type:complete
VTGWPLIIALLILGGLLATLGDRLGSFIGKARLSIFKLRPKRTAVFITVFTGSLISAISLGFMLLVSRQLRVGLFELDDLQEKLKQSRLALAPLQEERKLLEERIQNGEKELKQLIKDKREIEMAFRTGDLVINSGESLASSILVAEDIDQIKEEINTLLQRANYYAYLKIRPGEKPNKQILLVRRGYIERLEELINKKGSWVVNIRSAGNVLLGENYIIAIPEVVANKKIVSKDEIIASIELNLNEFQSKNINKKVGLLISKAKSEIRKRGSISAEILMNSNKISNKENKNNSIKPVIVTLNAISTRDSFTADSVNIRLEIRSKKMQT